MPIKMTKELPTEDGVYFHAEEGLAGDVRIVELVSHDDDYLSFKKRVEFLGGYWARVEDDQFEFEG